MSWEKLSILSMRREFWNKTVKREREKEYRKPVKYMANYEEANNTI